MSEYQYHEWQAVDRVLIPEELAAVNDLVYGRHDLIFYLFMLPL